MCNCTFPCTCLAEVSATVAATAEGLPEAAVVSSSSSSKTAEGLPEAAAKTTIVGW